MTTENTQTINTNEIIPAIVAGEPATIASAFDAAITANLADKIEDRKVELSKEMFSIGQPEDTSDEDVELTDAEWDEIVSELEAEETDNQPEENTDDNDEEV